MKTLKSEILALAAGALLAAAAITPSQAATAVDRWIADSQYALQSRVAQAGLADDGKAVTIRIKATADDKRYAPQVERSSGSADFDIAVREALKGVKLAPPPVEITGRGVTFTLGETAPAGASASAD